MKYSVFQNIKNGGFTLIELLVVIAILGVLVIGLMVAIDPADKIAAANDARVQTAFGTLARSSEAYATIRNGYYPSQLSDLGPTGGNELKNVPTAPSASYTFVVQRYTGAPPVTAAACTAGHLASPTCTGFGFASDMRSKRYTATCAAGTFAYHAWSSLTGKACTVCAANAAAAITAVAGASPVCI